MTTGNWLFAFIPVMLAYSGWNASAYVAEEIRDPGRNLPRSLAIGTLAVIAVYFGINLLYLFVFSITELAALKGSVLDVVADRLLGSGAGHVMGIVSIVSLLASNSAMTFAGPRVYFAMARDGVFFDTAAKVHPTYRTPAFAIIAQTIWTSLLILTGSGNALQVYTGFSITLFLGVAVFALFVLRWREPNAPRPFKALGYPVAPAIFTIACFVILANALYNDLVRPLIAGTRDRPVGVGLPGDRTRVAGLLLLRAQTIVPKFQRSKVQGLRFTLELWTRGTVEPRLGPRPEVLLNVIVRPGWTCTSISRSSKPGMRTSILCPPCSSRSCWKVPSKSSTTPA